MTDIVEAVARAMYECADTESEKAPQWDNPEGDRLGKAWVPKGTYITLAEAALGVVRDTLNDPALIAELAAKIEDAHAAARLSVVKRPRWTSAARAALAVVAARLGGA
jgi:hypothetical protein